MSTIRSLALGVGGKLRISESSGHALVEEQHSAQADTHHTDTALKLYRLRHANECYYQGSSLQEHVLGAHASVRSCERQIQLNKPRCILKHPFLSLHRCIDAERLFALPKAIHRARGKTRETLLLCLVLSYPFLL
jgi:sulfur relay (sulfurtransferase) DsrF/TusC family protein